MYIDFPVPVNPQNKVGITFNIFYCKRKEYLMVSIVFTIISDGINLSEIVSDLSIKSFQFTH
jgi:hypothetical protein